jgi:hypothetical protein
LLRTAAYAELLEARLYCCRFSCCRRLDLAPDIQLLAAGLDLRDDLRHDALLVDGGEHKAVRDGCDAGKRGNLRGLLLRECQLRPRQEEVVHELRAGLAELREVGDRRLVRLNDLATTASAAEAARVLLRRQRHGEVRSDRRERVERGLLGPVEPTREAGDRDHERDAECKPHEREDRSRSATHELATQVAEIEHCAQLAALP